MIRRHEQDTNRQNYKIDPMISVIAVLKIHAELSVDVREYKQSQTMCKYRMYF